MMRVLHVHSGNLFGGVETLLTTLVQSENLCPEMTSHFALCWEGRFSEGLNSLGAPIHLLGGVRFSHPLTVMRARRRLRKLLRQEHFDLVVLHSAWSQAVFGAAVRAAGIPLVSYLHAPPDGRHWLERLARRTPPDLAICNSDFTAGMVSLLYPKVRSEVIYSPVAPPKKALSESNKRLIREELQTPVDAIVIIQVGRMERLKGHRLHLEALGLLKDLPGWVCWIVGGAQRQSELQYAKHLKATARSLQIADRVRFLGQRSDVSMLLAAADIYCQPNTEPDSFGITFVEALYAGLPVLTSALGGPREIIDAACGMLISPGDVRGLAASLELLLQDPSLRANLGNAGPARARQLCDPATQSKQIYNQLKGMRPRANGQPNG